MMEKQLKLKIYLQHMKKPLIFMLTSDDQVKKLMAELSVDKIVKLGQVIFNAEDFIYAIVEELN